MSTYLIGDVQGCWRTLRALLGHIGFSSARDRIWFTGDLVNRGTGSLEVLRFALDLGDAAASVLGNHDLHLLGRAAGVRRAKRRDTLQQILEAPDRDDLIDWLGACPLLLRDEERGLLLVHAGVLPQWDADETVALAREVEEVLRGPRCERLLADDPHEQIRRWRADLADEPRWRVVLAAMTRLRVCTADGRMKLAFKGPPKGLPANVFPWYAAPGRRSSNTTIAFGHWAAHGYGMGEDWIALDSGCVWGGSLTAMRLDDRAVFAVDCVPSDRVG